MLTIGLVLAAAAAFWFRERISSKAPAPTVTDAASPAAASADPAKPVNDMIIVGERAQKNLSISAKQLKADRYWKSITVPGMIVDKPGVSDRLIVAPATGVVTEILRVPGETVKAGEVLFNLRLMSDSLNDTQTELLKAAQDTRLAHDRLERLESAGDGVPRVRIIEIESGIVRLEASARALRHELQQRGFSTEHLETIEGGTLIKELLIVAPTLVARRVSSNVTLTSSAGEITDAALPQFEVQELSVEVGQEVQAGQSLCELANHNSLMIEGRAFRDETLLLEQTIKQGWPVQVDFQEKGTHDWPKLEESFFIRNLANTIDPDTRAFAFRIPLENQSVTVTQGDSEQLLWRFRPGQKVRVEVPVDKLSNVFLLPSDAVVQEGADTYVFTQNINMFERVPVHVVFRDHKKAVIANDGALKTFQKQGVPWTVPAVVQTAAAQLNRMTKAGSSDVPKGFHIHADGSLHKNEDEAK